MNFHFVNILGWLASFTEVQLGPAHATKAASGWLNLVVFKCVQKCQCNYVIDKNMDLEELSAWGSVHHIKWEKQLQKFMCSSLAFKGSLRVKNVYLGAWH